MYKNKLHKKNYFQYLLSAFFTISIALYPQMSISAEADTVRLTFLHTNDVYEISPVAGGLQGGIARVATLKKQLLAANPNTYLTLSGDVYGPSGLSNVAMVDGVPLSGKQVVAALNKTGVDYFTFGDHEFDQFSEAEILKRFQETTFPMLSSNYADVTGRPFTQSDGAGGVKDIPKNAIFTASNAEGATIRVGIFGVTEPFRRSQMEVTYTEREEAITAQVAELKGGNNPVDVLIALTHFKESIDVEIAKQFPEIDLILGGDDHENVKVDNGVGFAPIFKSDSNARNVYVVDLSYDTADKSLQIESRVEPVTNALADDPEVLAEVDKWVQIGFDALQAQGIDAREVLTQAPFDLDGFSTSIRKKQTALTHLILRGMTNVTNADTSLFLSGYLRLDDLLPKGGDVTGYDVVRAFPNDFDVASVRMTGSTLIGELDFGQKLIGSGGFLLFTDDIGRDANDNWTLKGTPIDAETIYVVGVETLNADALLQNDKLVSFENGDFIKTSGSTVRQIFTNELKALAESNNNSSDNGGSFSWYLLPLFFLLGLWNRRSMLIRLK